jgi:hypothetical protein
MCERHQSWGPASDNGTPSGTSDGDAPEAGGQAVTALLKRTGGGGAL